MNEISYVKTPGGISATGKTHNFQIQQWIVPHSNDPFWDSVDIVGVYNGFESYDHAREYLVNDQVFMKGDKFRIVKVTTEIQVEEMI